MKTAESVLDILMDPESNAIGERDWRLIDINPQTVPWSSVAGFSSKLGIEPAALLRLIGVSERTAARRKAEGYLKPDEADRLLRVGRIYEEATRVFGAETAPPDG